ncbi:MAG: cohesin domain-containing protein [Pyrinomonadaceae bacterium]
MNKQFYVVIGIMFLILNLGLAVRAQSAVDGFDPNTDGGVSVIVLQPDGKILVGGSFFTFSPNGGAPVTRNRIARLNPDGSLDTVFNPNANGFVGAIAVQTDGKILVGGSFTTIGGQPRNLLARLDAVTGLADSFDPNGSGPVNPQINELVVQADGKILAGGLFANIGGQARNNIVRLDAATGLADSFDPNADNQVVTIAVQADGKILTGGQFMNIGGAARSRIARLDPVTGVADSWNPNANSRVISIAVQPNGMILAGGFFQAGFGTPTIGGQTRNRIARLDPVTGLADSFNPNANNFVYKVVIQADGRILVCGDFKGANSIGGVVRNNIARLDPLTGAVDSFDPNVNSLTVFAIAQQPDGKVLAGGIFTALAPSGGASVTRNRIARLEANGLLDRTLNLNLGLGTDNNVSATAVQPDGKILIGGQFTSVLGATRNNIARLNVDGTLDTAFDPNSNSVVRAIAIQTDGKILVGVAFSPGGNTIGGQTRNGIARLDATTGAADSWNPNSNGSINALAVQADGKIVAGGSFSNIGGQTRSDIARLDAGTGLADSFNPNANLNVLSIAVQADGKILAGGQFTSIGVAARTRIARLDAVTGLADSFNPNAGTNPNDVVRPIAVQGDGKILVGGVFSNIGGQTRQNIARLDATTGVPDSFNPNATGTTFTSVHSIGVQSDGKILAGGSFDSIGGAMRNRIARVDAVTGLADSFDPNANEFVTSITAQADGKILAGGYFTSIGGQTRGLFARLTNDTAALQNLAVTQNTITWTRGGSGPQFTRVTFESSTDSVNYTAVGSGTASGSNWILTGLNLPTAQNLHIRARGYYRSGYNNGSESSTESVRNAYLVPGATISGTITYGNAIGNPAPPRFVKNVSVASTAGSPAVGPVLTGTPGTYSLTGFGSGSYTIKPTKPGGANGAITSNDAARVSQGVTGALQFVSQNQRFAADVTGNGVISSQDAAKLAQFAAGLPFSPPNLSGQWRFFVTGAPSPLPTPPQTYNDSRTYASVTSSLEGEDYVAILIGEASGNWNPATHARPVDSRQLEAAEIAVDIPTLATSADKEITVPVNVQRVADKEVISYEFDLKYDPSVIQPLAEPVDVAGTVSRGLSVVTNALEPGLLRVVVYGAMPIDEDGLLMNLRFSAVGAPDTVSPLTWERIMFNEGESRVTTLGGQIEILAALAAINN